jgi:ribosomal protein L19
MAMQAKFKDTIFNVGDLIKVHQKVIEAGKERTQVFEGIVIAIPRFLKGS